MTCEWYGNYIRLHYELQTSSYDWYMSDAQMILVDIKSYEKVTLNKEMIMIIIVTIIKLIIETIYILTGNSKQYFFRHAPEKKKKIALNLLSRYDTGLLANCSGFKPDNWT